MSRDQSWRQGQHKIRKDLKGEQVGFFDTKYGGMGGNHFFQVGLAQAPVDGIPARVGATPGVAICTQVIHAPRAGAGFSVGDLVKTSKTFRVKNDSFSVHGAEGDRIIWVSSHDDNSILVGSECDNEGNPASILLYEPT